MAGNSLQWSSPACGSRDGMDRHRDHCSPPHTPTRAPAPRDDWGISASALPKAFYSPSKCHLPHSQVLLPPLGFLLSRFSFPFVFSSSRWLGSWGEVPAPQWSQHPAPSPRSGALPTGLCLPCSLLHQKASGSTTAPPPLTEGTAPAPSTAAERASAASAGLGAAAPTSSRNAFVRKRYLRPRRNRCPVTEAKAIAPPQAGAEE